MWLFALFWHGRVKSRRLCRIYISTRPSFPSLSPIVRPSWPRHPTLKMWRVNAWDCQHPLQYVFYLSHDRVGRALLCSTHFFVGPDQLYSQGFPRGSYASLDFASTWRQRGSICICTSTTTLFLHDSFASRSSPMSDVSLWTSICALIFTTPCIFVVGTVTCLKDGCNQTIPLTRRVGTSDGGKAAGFGSLSAYRVCFCMRRVFDRMSPFAL